jgi:hypothetical protein
MKLEFTPTNIAIGAAAVILTPIVVPAVGAVAKPLLRGLIKGGFLLFEQAKIFAAEAKETIEDLTAEAKAELVEIAEEAKSELAEKIEDAVEVVAEPSISESEA